MVVKLSDFDSRNPKKLVVNIEYEIKINGNSVDEAKKKLDAVIKSIEDFNNIENED